MFITHFVFALYLTAENSGMAFVDIELSFISGT